MKSDCAQMFGLQWDTKMSHRRKKGDSSVFPVPQTHRRSLSVHLPGLKNLLFPCRQGQKKATKEFPKFFSSERSIPREEKEAWLMV